MSLFNLGEFKLHSGETSNFKIDCDALTDQDIESVANIIGSKFNFKEVVGIPSGGIRLANSLKKYIKPQATKILIVDDVLTTGKSMEEYLANYPDSMGAVIFARNDCKANCYAVFKMF